MKVALCNLLLKVTFIKKRSVLRETAMLPCQARETHCSQLQAHKDKVKASACLLSLRLSKDQSDNAQDVSVTNSLGQEVNFRLINTIVKWKETLCPLLCGFLLYMCFSNRRQINPPNNVTFSYSQLTTSQFKHILIPTKIVQTPHHN